jgi:flagellar biosynthesis protein FliQ
MSEYRFFLFHKLLVVGLNCLMVVALFVAMYRASLYPDDFTLVFFKTIFSLLIPTLLLGLVGKLILRHRCNAPT